MAIDHLAIASCQHRDLKSELVNGRAHPIDSAVISPRISRVKNQAIQTPILDLQIRRDARHDEVALRSLNSREKNQSSTEK
jgi:hypothetical protein